MIFREICNLKIGWDTQLPDQLRYKWKKWKRSLSTSVSVPRSIQEFQVYIQKIDLRAFGYASKDGVCATVYSIVHQSSGVSQGLLCSKLRLSKKDLIIPMLELVACHTYINPLDNAKKAITGYPVDKLVAWTGGSTTLQWILGNGNYKQFVKNRADKIHEKKEIAWRYVNTNKNSADTASGKMSVAKVEKLLWNGLGWLGDFESSQSDIKTKATTKKEKEAKIIKDMMTSTIRRSDVMDDILQR